jgi:hypothetical protein
MEALSHPWITRKLNERLPLSSNQLNQIAAKNYATEEKLRQAVGLMLFCQIAAGRAGKSSNIDEYKRILIAQSQK